ncbi:MAG: FKBP-type peptidyl-prolyl cis-trans isomerase [Prosthecobacter sp.]|jgi:FKBP-type peptidyl-prolyl cis-trans isomerase
MNKLHTAFLFAAVSMLGQIHAQEVKKAEPATAAPPTVDMDKVSYFIGKNVGGQFAGQKEKIDLNAFIEGVNDIVGSKKPAGYAMGIGLGQQFKSEDIAISSDKLKAGIERATGAATGAEPYTQEELTAAMDAFNQLMQSKQQAKMLEEQKEMAAAAGKYKEEGKKYLAENGKRKGVTTTASGLQYEVLKEGTGPKPAVTDSVNVHYHGTLIDGKVFDSSVERGEPTSFPLQGVIRGWTEGLQLMPVGSKWRFHIPSDLAYGDQAQGDDIPPGSTLIFDVELLGIVK